MLQDLLSNNCYADYEYDAANRVTAIRNCLSDGTALAYSLYAYDENSRITRVTRENDDIIYYGYDTADRLTSEHWIATGGGTIYAFEWQYDAVGNRRNSYVWCPQNLSLMGMEPATWGAYE